MSKSHKHSTWVKENFQHKNYQSTIFTGFDNSMLSPICIMIDKLVENIDLSCFEQYYKANDITGGRPNLDYAILLKIYMYSLYNDIRIRKIEQYFSLGTELHYLSLGIHHFPKSTVFSKFLKYLDIHVDDIFYSSLEYIRAEIDLDTSILYCDGTVFEADNSRHKIITDTNIARSNKKWTNVLNSPDSSEEDRELAKGKLELNIDRTANLEAFDRTSYGRTDEDCVILKDKNGSFIAGYNAQFIEENKYGLIIYAYISNKNPDSVAFLDIIDDLADKYHPEYLTLDMGYGTPEILEKLRKQGITPVVKTLKNENASKKTTNNSFSLSENDDCLICPEGQRLHFIRITQKGNHTYKASHCELCERKEECSPKSNAKSVTINLNEAKLLKQAKETIESEYGIELYSHRGNKCESPHGFIKYNLNGKKFKMRGLVRNNTNIKLDSILYDLTRLISIKSIDKK